jgi:hypothetical protein
MGVDFDKSGSNTMEKEPCEVFITGHLHEVGTFY